MVTGLKPPPRIDRQQSNAIYQQMGNETLRVAFDLGDEEEVDSARRRSSNVLACGHLEILRWQMCFGEPNLPAPWPCTMFCCIKLSCCMLLQYIPLYTYRCCYCHCCYYYKLYYHFGYHSCYLPANSSHSLPQNNTMTTAITTPGYHKPPRPAATTTNKTGPLHHHNKDNNKKRQNQTDYFHYSTTTCQFWTYLSDWHYVVLLPPHPQRSPLLLQTSTASTTTTPRPSNSNADSSLRGV